MNKKLTYGLEEPQEVRNETISGFSLLFQAINGGGTIAPIASLNNTQLKLSIKRQGMNNEEILFSGRLDDYLTLVYGQTPSYELCKKVYGLTYKMMLPLGGTVVLKGQDVLTVSIKAEATTFTGLDIANNNNYIKLESIPALGHQTQYWMAKSIGIGNGEQNINKSVGNNVEKIVLATDYTSDYFNSVKAKPIRVEISGVQYERSVSQDVLEVENIQMFDNNPESDIAQTVLFWANGLLLQKGKVNVQLDKVADGDARLLVLHRTMA